jgi:hypothetical protein
MQTFGIAELDRPHETVVRVQTRFDP